MSHRGGPVSNTDRHYAYSELTGTWYHVHDYTDLGDGRIIAHGKTEVDKEEVPASQRRRILERVGDGDE